MMSSYQQEQINNLQKEIEERDRTIEELKNRIHKDFIELQVRSNDLEHKDKEIEERDRIIAQLNHDLENTAQRILTTDQ